MGANSCAKSARTTSPQCCRPADCSARRASLAAALSIDGQVQAGGGAVAGSTVTLWVASAAEPRQLAQARTGAYGRFDLATDVTPGDDTSLYVVANGGE